MAAYMIFSLLEITDQEAWDEYGSKVRAVLDDYGARVLAADPEPKVLEGDWSGIRNGIIEFPDMDESSVGTIPTTISRCLRRG